jgi:hypothetical protein
MFNKHCKSTQILTPDHPNTGSEAKPRSWVYSHSEKRRIGEQTYFYCQHKYKSGKQCTFKVESKKGSTSAIANHLKEKHSMKPPKNAEKVQTNLTLFNLKNMPRQKTFREAFAELIAKQYLPFSLVEEKVLQDSYLAFMKEKEITKVQPSFVTRKTVADDIAKMADEYVAKMSKRFKSKLSLSMDIWTGPNRMSFLGITFTYLDENFIIQRGLLDMVKMKKRHYGYYIANLFEKK